MTRQPYIRVGIPLRHIVVQISYRPVVVALLPKRFDEAGVVARICSSHAVADLLPENLATLTATAGSEKVVIQLVVAGRVSTVEDRRRRSWT